MTKYTTIDIFRTRAEARLERIYGTTSAKPLLERLVGELTAFPLPAPCPWEGRLWDQRDVILISYGDSICSGNEQPLTSLRIFFEQKLAGLISTLHLLPFFPYSSDDGFAVIDYLQVNPELGDWQQITELNRQVDLMLDLVINHVSSQHRWFQQFINQEQPGCDYLCDPGRRR